MKEYYGKRQTGKLKGHLLLQRTWRCVCVWKAYQRLSRQIVPQFSPFVMQCIISDALSSPTGAVNIDRTCLQPCTHMRTHRFTWERKQYNHIEGFTLLYLTEMSQQRAYSTSSFPVYNSFKHYIFFLISIIYSLDFVLFRSSAVSNSFLYFCSIFRSAVE